MAKRIQYKPEVLPSLFRGIKKLAHAVKVTLGPQGRNVVVSKEFGYPISTKDGAMVAKEVSLKDPFEDMGAQLIREAANKTASLAGDGSTTSIVLAESLFSEGMKRVVAGANPTALKRGMDKSLQALLTALSQMAKKISSPEELKQIATISVNHEEELGSLIAKAMEEVGSHGIVTTKEGKGIETSLEVVKGMQLEKGYLSPYFVTDGEKMQVELQNCKILITDKKLSTAQDVVPILEKAAQASASPLLILAEEIEAEALTTLVLNKVKGRVSVCAIKAPGFGDRKKAMLQDAAILTGAKVVSEEVGLKLEEVDLSVLGAAEMVKVSQDKTILVGGKGAKGDIEARMRQIQVEIEKSSSEFDQEKLKERLASLGGGVAVIHVGAPTEQEMKEKKTRIEDAIHATQAAAQEGTVPGGGVALLRAIASLDALKLTDAEEAMGKEIVRKACFMPLTVLADNGGKAGNLVAEKVFQEKGNHGYNVRKDSYCDLSKEGILDPVFVTKSALTHAVSIAGLLLTAEVMVVDKPKKASASPRMPPGGGMPGGMGGMGGMMPGMM